MLFRSCTPASDHRVLSRLSPDGRWLAYTAMESQTFHVYVQRYPELDRKIQISSDTGSNPVWSPDGRRLYYRSQDRMMAVDVRPGADPPFSKATLVFEKEYGTGKAFTHFSYDVATDGRLLMTLRDSASYPREISLVLGWDRELAARFER